MASNQDLESWIASSRQHRHSLRVGLCVFAGIALLVSLSSRTIGMMMLGLVGITGVGGSWIIAAHISDWESQLQRRRIPRR
jgi:dolichyl-phosphate-mannose--protein O-mannosyl transferase